MKKSKLLFTIFLGLAISQAIRFNNKNKQKILYSKVLDNAKQKFADSNTEILGSWIDENPILTDETVLCKGGLTILKNGQKSIIEFVSDMMDQQVIRYTTKPGI